MISVEVRNFQSIERASFQIDGFTSLVGRSNIGKSALVRAVRCALTGSPVASFVRHGAACARKTKGQKTCKCHVSVRLKSVDFDLLWEKGDGVNRYVFNGAEYPAAERGMPDFLSSAFQEIKVGDKDVLLQVADQFNPIFLLDQSATAVADVLSDMAKLDQVNIAIRLSEKDRREASSTRKVREKDLLDARVKLASFDGLDSAVLDVKAVQAKLTGIQRGRAKVAVLGRFLRSEEALRTQVTRLDGVCLLVPPDLAPTRCTRDSFLTLHGMCVKARDRKTILESLRGVDGITLPVLAPLRSQAEKAQQLVRWVDRLLVFRASFARFKNAPDLVLPTGPLPNTTRYQQIAKMQGRLDALTKSLGVLEGGHGEAAREAASLKKEWEALGLCSGCSRPFHPEPDPPRV